jgi:hypothetical protein
MAQTTIYLTLSGELQAALADNGLNIENILQQDQIDATVTHGVFPVQTETGARTKDIATVILVSGVLVASVAFSISQVLNTIYNRPHLVEYDELEELRDGDGNLILDEFGKPLFKPVKRFELLVPDQRHKSEYEAQLDLTRGLSMKFVTEQEKQEHQPTQ